MFHRGIVTKSIVCEVNVLYFIILCVTHYNGMTQKPYNHLFQKSGQRGLTVLQHEKLKIPQSYVSPRHCNQIDCL